MASQVYRKFNDHHWILNQYIKSKLLDVLQVTDSTMIPIRDNFPTDINLDNIPFKDLNNLFFSFKKTWDEIKINHRNNHISWDDF
jgi:hypothetical protein